MLGGGYEVEILDSDECGEGVGNVLEGWEICLGGTGEGEGSCEGGGKG